MNKPKQGMALILSIFLVLALTSFISLATFQYVSDAMLLRHYEDSLQVFYELEAAKTICMWEEAQSLPYRNNWATSGAGYDSTCKLANTNIDIHDFYKLTGYNFRAKVYNNAGVISIYAHAFKGTESAPRSSQYLEYLFTPSPMYQYMIFSNRSLTFSGEPLYDCKGGKVHSNKDIIFQPWGTSIRFNLLKELSAVGTLKYATRYQYPAPHYLDNLDGRPDGMAPAPWLNLSGGSPLYYPHYQTTTGVGVTPGPDKYWYLNSEGAYSLEWQSYGNWLGGDWGSYGRVPLVWRGIDTYFYGRQYSGSGYNVDEMYLGNLKLNGEYNDHWWDPAVWPLLVPIIAFDTPSSSVETRADTNKSYYRGDVHFRPYKDKFGNDYNRWVQIPGALPQDYSWEAKYAYLSGSEAAVTFYVTEACPEGSAGCQVSKGPNPSINTGWRYIKKDSVSDNFCTDDSCYNSPASVYVKAQDYATGGTMTDWVCYDAYIAAHCDSLEQLFDACCAASCCMAGTGECEEYGSRGHCCRAHVCKDQYDALSQCANDASINCTRGKKYYDNLGLREGDHNDEFFSDYSYGNDANDINSPDRNIRAFNSQKQLTAFQQYLDKLSQKDVEGILISGAARQDPSFGKIFDDSLGDSPYKIKARDNGIYIDGSQDMGSIVANLNRSLSDENKFAKVASFFNWKTNREVTLIDIDIEKMKLAGREPANGLIYSEYPLRLSSAENLPGQNTDKTAVFTVICEESVYLKGNYNYDPADPEDTSRNWKISHIATKKKVYTLSDQFNDPDEAPSFAIYPEYPYVYIKVDRTGSMITRYYPEQGDPALGNGIWVNADSVGSKDTEGNYIYYYGMPDSIRSTVVTIKKNKENAHVTDTDFHPPNRVCECAGGCSSCEYTYNSLFISPYDNNQGDYTLENWYYIGRDGNEHQAKKKIKGAFLDLYDPDDSERNDEYLSNLAAEEATWDYREANTYTTLNRWYIQNYGARVWQASDSNYYGGYAYPSLSQDYDDRFPHATPTSYQSVLGVTGTNVWRLISEAYFNSQT